MELLRASDGSVIRTYAFTIRSNIPTPTLPPTPTHTPTARPNATLTPTPSVVIAPAGTAFYTNPATVVGQTVGVILVDAARFERGNDNPVHPWQWLRCDDAQENGCVSVPPNNARGIGGSYEYTLTAADMGKYLQASVLYNDTDGSLTLAEVEYPVGPITAAQPTPTPTRTPTPTPTRTPAPTPTPPASAALSPNPSSVTFYADGAVWHRFTVNANETVKVVANPTGTARRVEINRTNPERTYCPAEQNDDKTRSNGQYIYLAGCAAGTGTVELRRASDDSVIRTYSFTIRSAVPTPTPTPQATASLSPSPSSVNFRADGQWHRFTLSAGALVRVIVNPGSHALRAEIATSSTSSNYCPPDHNDGHNFSNGQSVYLAGCVVGTGVVEIRRASDNYRIRTYTFTISAPPPTPTPTATPPPQCLPVSNFSAGRTLLGSVRLSWTNPSGGLTVIRRSVAVKKWVNNQWVTQSSINASSQSIGAYHLGADHDAYYAYTVRSECAGGQNSAWSSWITVGPFTGDAARAAASAEPEPTPTPVPGGSAPPYGDVPEELPPLPIP